MALLDHTVSTIVITDVEPDDLLAIGYLLYKQVDIVRIVVLNHQFQTDGWNREHLLKDYLRVTNHQSLKVDVYTDINSVSVDLRALVANYPTVQLIALGNWLPILELSQNYTYPTDQKTINVFGYGSVNIRWAAQMITGGFDRVAQILNSNSSPYRFYIFETFGAFGDRRYATVTNVNMKKVYDMLAENQYQSNKHLVKIRTTVVDWNRLMLTKFHGQNPEIIGIFDDYTRGWIDHPEYIEDLRTLTQPTKLSPFVMLILENPWEFVCADIGLVICALDSTLVQQFKPCTAVEFSQPDGYTVPKFKNSGNSHLYYYKSDDQASQASHASTLAQYETYLGEFLKK